MYHTIEPENIFVSFVGRIPADLAQELYTQMSRKFNQGGHRCVFTTQQSINSVKKELPFKYLLASIENKTVDDFLVTFYQTRLNMLPIVGKKAANEFVYRELYAFMETYKS